MRPPCSCGGFSIINYRLYFCSEGLSALPMRKLPLAYENSFVFQNPTHSPGMLPEEWRVTPVAERHFGSLLCSHPTWEAHGAPGVVFTAALSPAEMSSAFPHGLSAGGSLLARLGYLSGREGVVSLHFSCPSTATC